SVSFPAYTNGSGGILVSDSTVLRLPAVRSASPDENNGNGSLAIHDRGKDKPSTDKCSPAFTWLSSTVNSLTPAAACGFEATVVSGSVSSLSASHSAAASVISSTIQSHLFFLIANAVSYTG